MGDARGHFQGEQCTPDHQIPGTSSFVLAT